MRADNTSVVIIMLDPPGPPKREVLKTCPSQLILENDEMDQQPLTEDKTFAMHDYCTKETVELNNIPSMLSSGINRYETVGYAHASTSNNIDVGYANSFAETYNSLLNANIGNDHAYTYQTHEPETHSTNSDDTYSLTKLETRMEQIASSSSPSMLFTDYQQRYDERHQYDCITSSYLSPACEILPNMEDSIQAVVVDVVEEIPNLIDNHNYSNGIDDETLSETNNSLCEMDNQPEASTSYEASIKSICSQMPSTSSASAMNDEYVMNDVLGLAVAIDETIQINEISSSSKENEEKSSNACNFMEKLTRSKTKCKSNEERRITRSNVLKPSDNGVGKHTVRNDKKLRSIVKKQLQVQNENVISVTSRLSRRNTNASFPFNGEVSKRSLRSDVTMSTKPTASTKARQTLHKPNRNTIDQSMSTSPFNIPETLREKIKPNQQTNTKPKNISKFCGKKTTPNAKQTPISKLQRSKRLNR